MTGERDNKIDDKIDGLASDLDDLKLTVEELQDELPPADAETLTTVTTALEKASDATDELGNRRNADPSN